MAESEVARLRQQIELECEAMRRGLTGTAAVTRHEIIRHRCTTLDSYRQQLAHCIGEQQAIKVMADIYCRVMEAE